MVDPNNFLYDLASDLEDQLCELRNRADAESKAATPADTEAAA